jgi:hypothetical protein
MIDFAQFFILVLQEFTVTLVNLQLNYFAILAAHPLAV